MTDTIATPTPAAAPPAAQQPTPQTTPVPTPVIQQATVPSTEKPKSLTDMFGASDAEWAKDLGITKPAEAQPASVAGAKPEAATAAPSEVTTPETQDSPAAASAEGEYHLDPQGRLHRPDGTFASADEVEAFKEVTGAPVAPAPETQAPDAPKANTIKPQGFIATDAEGNPLEELPDLRVTYTANGKERKNVPLNTLIRQAQDAVYNKEIQDEAIQSRQVIAETQRLAQEYEQAFQQLNDYTTRLLSDEAFLVQALQTFSQQNTPEAQLAALRAENEALRTGQTARSAHDAARPVVERIASSVSQIHQQYPDVTEDEVLGRFNRLTSHLLVGGQLPPDRLADVERIVATDLAHWAQATHVERAESRAQQTKQTADAQQRVKAEQIKAALAKRTLARAVAPKNGQAPQLRESPQQKTYASTDDIMADIGNIVAGGLTRA